MTAQAVAALRVRTDLPRTRIRGRRNDPVCLKLALGFQRCSWRYPWSACRSCGAGARGGPREIEITASARPESLNLRLSAVQRIALTLGSLHGLVCLDSLGPASNARLKARCSALSSDRPAQGTESKPSGAASKARMADEADGSWPCSPTSCGKAIPREPEGDRALTAQLH